MRKLFKILLGVAMLFAATAIIISFLYVAVLAGMAGVG